MASRFDYASVTPISESRSRDVVWRRLSQFQDIERAAERLMRQRSDIPFNQKTNVKKQIQQLSFSLTQAREFLKSAETSGPTTRALQAYYGLTALANVKILWDGTGNDSFECREGRYNAHGLELKLDDKILGFAAKPKRHSDGSLSGLFGLWHKYASHIPQYAETTDRHGFDSQSLTVRPSSSVTRLSDIAFPNVEITLLDCLSHIPALQQSLISYGMRSSLVRGRIQIQNSYDSNHERTQGVRSYTLHPSAEETHSGVIKKFLFPPEVYEDITIITPPGGIIVHLDTTRNNKSYSSSAETFPGTKQLCFFVGDGDYLNEFGYYYVALYIAGMITRYHPTHWIKDLQTNSIATALIDELVDSAVTRVPLLVLTLLERNIFIYE